MDDTAQAKVDNPQSRPVLPIARSFLARYWPAFTTLATLLFALAGQILVQGREQVSAGVLCLLAAIVLFLITISRGAAIRLGQYPDRRAKLERVPLVHSWSLRLILGLGAAYLLISAYDGFAHNRLDGGFFSWVAGILLFLAATMHRPDWSWRGFVARFDWRWATAVLLVTGLAVFFRTYRLVETPIEMTSDHAEKLLDVYDVLIGQRPIFFARNTGREMFQFYLTAALIRFTPLEIGHLALKVGTAIFGILAVPVTYFLGKQEYGRVVGILAAFFLAVSHWHVAITRVGLRFPFTPAFAIPALFFLLRAFRYNRRNDWLAAGLVLGLGLHTYTAMRIVPVLFIVLVVLKMLLDGLHYWRRPGKPLSTESSAFSWAFWQNAILGGLASLALFLPLLRVIQEMPEIFWYRAQSRAVSPDALTWVGMGKTLLTNVQNALLMFNYQGDVVPINTNPMAPVLGIVSGGLFVLGAAYLLWRLLRRPERRDLYLVVAAGMLLLPSILSLAFPGENPSVVRTAGAAPLVMIMVALPLAALLKRLWGLGFRVLSIILIVLLLGLATVDNYRWYFIDYHQQTVRSLWNASEMGAEVREFLADGGSMHQVYHVAYPHWVDTRNIAINAGDITWRNAVLDLQEFYQHAAVPEAKLYLVHIQDNAAVNLLNEVYPNGRWRIYRSDRPGKDFRLFYVPAGGGTGSASSGVSFHFWPSSMSITGIPSRMGYFKPLSSQTSQVFFTSRNRPGSSPYSFDCTARGQRKISSNSASIDNLVSSAIPTFTPGA